MLVKLSIIFLAFFLVWVAGISYSIFTYQLTLNTTINNTALTAKSQSDLIAQVEVLQYEIKQLNSEIDETDVEMQKRLAFLECQTDMAVAGFRSGHTGARKLMVAGVFDSCNESIRLRYIKPAEVADDE